MNLAEHKLNLFRQIDQLPEELILELSQFIAKLQFKTNTDSNMNVLVANDKQPLAALTSFLKPRIEAAEREKVIYKSVAQIFAEVHEEELL